MRLAAWFFVIPYSVLLGLQAASTAAGADHGTLVVRDCEQVPKSVDTVVAEVDTQPQQVLIETSLVEIKLREGMQQGVDPSLFDKAEKAWRPFLDSSSTGAALASGRVRDGVSADAPHDGFAKNANDWKLGWIGNDPKGFIRASEAFGKTKVLAAPRLLVLDKQRAEVHLGDRLQVSARPIRGTSKKDETPTVDHIDIGTKLLVRPFVSSDRAIRVELHLEHSTGHLDDRGVPQTETTQVTTNVMVPDGTTVALAFPPCTETAKGKEASSLTKKQLIVLVTARLWERHGDNLHPASAALPARRAVSGSGNPT